MTKNEKKQERQLRVHMPFNEIRQPITTQQWAAAEGLIAYRGGVIQLAYTI